MSEAPANEGSTDDVIPFAAHKGILRSPGRKVTQRQVPFPLPQLKPKQVILGKYAEFREVLIQFPGAQRSLDESEETVGGNDV